MIADELLAAYAAGELSNRERETVEAALIASPQSRAEVSRYLQIFLLIAAAAEELETPVELEGRIARQVAVRAYLNLAFDLASDLLGAYGRAIVCYLRLD